MGVGALVDEVGDGREELLILGGVGGLHGRSYGSCVCAFNLSLANGFIIRRMSRFFGGGCWVGRVERLNLRGA